MTHPFRSRCLLAALAFSLVAAAGCRQSGVPRPGFLQRESAAQPTPLLDNSGSDDGSPQYEELPPSPSARRSPVVDDETSRPAGFEDAADDIETPNSNSGSSRQPQPVIIPARPRALVPLRERDDGPIANLESPGPQLDSLQFLAELTAEKPTPAPRQPVAAVPPALAPVPPVAVVRTPAGVDHWPRDGVPATIVVCPGPVARSLVQPVPNAHRETRSWGIGTFE